MADRAEPFGLTDCAHRFPPILTDGMGCLLDPHVWHQEWDKCASFPRCGRDYNLEGIAMVSILSECCESQIPTCDCTDYASVKSASAEVNLDKLFVSKLQEETLSLVLNKAKWINAIGVVAKKDS